MLKVTTLFIILFNLNRYCHGEVYALRFDSQFYFEEFEDIPSTFGGKLTNVVRGMLIASEPADACNVTVPAPKVPNDTGKWILLIARYTLERNCSFEQKIRVAQAAGYDAAIVHNVFSNALVPMSANNDTGIFIPSVFVSESAGNMLRSQYSTRDYFIVITGESPFNIQTHLLIPFAIVVGICFIVMVVFMVYKFVKDRRRERRHRLPTSALNKIPTCKFQKGDPYETCVICLDDYVEGDKLRVLPCNHVYHTKCIDPWLTKNRRVCPICKRKVFAQDETHYSDSESDTDDTTPLISSANNRVTQGGTFEEQTENPIQRAARSISQLSGATTAYMTTSDHHSINGEYRSISESETSSSEESLVRSDNNGQHTCDIEVYVDAVDDINNTRNSEIV